MHPATPHLKYAGSPVHCMATCPIVGSGRLNVQERRAPLLPHLDLRLESLLL
jgi:hypothetical protein